MGKSGGMLAAIWLASTLAGAVFAVAWLMSWRPTGNLAAWAGWGLFVTAVANSIVVVSAVSRAIKRGGGADE